MATYLAGDAAVRLLPNSKNFHHKAREELKIGGDLNHPVTLKASITGFRADARERLKTVPELKHTVKLHADLTGFRKAAQAKIDATGRLSAKVHLTIDKGSLSPAIKEIKADLAAAKFPIKLTFDRGSLGPSIRALKTELAALDLKVKVKVEIDDNGYRMKLLLLTRPVNQRIRLNIDAAEMAALRAMLASLVIGTAGVGGKGASSMMGFAGAAKMALLAVVALAAVSLVPLLGQLAQAAGVLALLPAMALSAGAVLATLGIGIAGVSKAFTAKGPRNAAESANQMASAQSRIASSERALRRAQEDSLRAQAKLNEERKLAVRRLRDMNDELDMSQWDEEGAAIGILRAQEALQDAYSTGTQLDQREARNELSRTNESYDQIIKKNEDLRNDVAAANKAGIEGDEGVADAKRGLVDALEGVVDAQDGVSEANQRMADTLNGSAGAVDDLAEAMAKLSPNQRDFVEKTKSLGEEWEKLRLVVGDNLFAGLGDEMLTLGKTKLPFLKEKLGGIATEINLGLKRALEDVNSESSKLDWTTIMDNTKASIGPLIDGLSSLWQALQDIAAVGSTFLPGIAGDFADTMKRFQEWTGSTEGQESIRSFISESMRTLGDVWEWAKALKDVIGGLFSTSDDAGETMIQSMTDSMNAFSAWMKTADGERKMKEFWEEVRETITNMMNLIGAAVRLADKISDIAVGMGLMPDPSVDKTPVTAAENEYGGGNVTSKPNNGSIFAYDLYVDEAGRNVDKNGRPQYGVSEGGLWPGLPKPFEPKPGAGAPLTYQGPSPDDLTRMSPEQKRAWTEQFAAQGGEAGLLPWKRHPSMEGPLLPDFAPGGGRPSKMPKAAPGGTKAPAAPAFIGPVAIDPSLLPFKKPEASKLPDFTPLTPKSKPGSGVDPDIQKNRSPLAGTNLYEAGLRSQLPAWVKGAPTAVKGPTGFAGNLKMPELPRIEDGYAKKLEDVGKKFEGVGTAAGAALGDKGASGALSGLTAGVDAATTKTGDSFSVVGSNLGGLGKVFGTVSDESKNKFAGMGQGVDATSRGITANSLPSLQGGLGTFQTFALGVVEAFGGDWARLGGMAAEPINWIIRNVINGALKNAWNAVAKVIPGLTEWDGVAEIPEVDGGQKFFGFNTGGIAPTAGVMSGYSPGRDDRLIAVGGGEAIMRPEWTRAMGPDYVNNANAAARSGGVDGVRRFAGAYATGGIVQDEGSITTPIQQSMWDAVRTAFPNAVLTSGTRYDDVGSGFDNHMGQRALDLGGPMSQIARWIYKMNETQPVLELIHAPLDGWQNLKNGSPLNFGAGTDADHLDHVHWAMDSMVGSDGKVVSNDGGGGLIGAAKNLLGRGVSAARGAAANVFQTAVDALGSTIPDFGPSLMGGLPKAAFEGITSAMIAKVRGASDGPGGGGYSADNLPTGSGPVVDQVKKAMAPYGWDTGAQWDALDQLIAHESSWDPNAGYVGPVNSDAYGLFQFLGTTWDDVGGVKTSDPYQQAVYGARYIEQRHTDPIGAWAHWQNPPGGMGQGHWYDEGGIANGIGNMQKNTLQPERVLSPVQTRAFEALVPLFQQVLGFQNGGKPLPVDIQGLNGRKLPNGQQLPVDTGEINGQPLQGATIGPNGEYIPAVTPDYTGTLTTGPKPPPLFSTTTEGKYASSIATSLGFGGQVAKLTSKEQPIADLGAAVQAALQAAAGGTEAYGLHAASTTAAAALKISKNFADYIPEASGGMLESALSMVGGAMAGATVNTGLSEDRVLNVVQDAQNRQARRVNPRRTR